MRQWISNTNTSDAPAWSGMVALLVTMKACYSSTIRRSGQLFRHRCVKHAACRDAILGSRLRGPQNPAHPLWSAACVRCQLLAARCGTWHDRPDAYSMGRGSAKSEVLAGSFRLAANQNSADTLTNHLLGALEVVVQVMDSGIYKL